MITFTAILEKFDEQGEKTSWTFFRIPAGLAQKLIPDNKRSFRVKGKLDNYSYSQVSLLPIGEGDFIMAFNSEMRKRTGKRKGEKIRVKMEVDEAPFNFSKDMMMCLEEEPLALKNFKKMPGSHQKYFSKWIESAKSPETKAKRIAQTVNAMLKGQRFNEMMRSLQAEKNLLR
ncbi:MAG: YdeI/OmpD-associated family protein [Chitinophagales bacterium]